MNLNPPWSAVRCVIPAEASLPEMEVNRSQVAWAFF